MSKKCAIAAHHVVIPTKIMLHLITALDRLQTRQLSQQCQRLYKGLFSSALMLGTGSFFIGLSSQPVLADPPPLPPPNTILPSVFCFRFTDIKAVEDDAEGDKFQVAFEVLNWSDQPAGGVRIALNTGTNSFVQDIAPSFAGAGVDGNGRPLGKDADPLPGNQLFANNGNVVESTDTAIQWTAEQFNLNDSSSGPIPNKDLLGVPSQGGTQQACNLVPGCQVVGGQPVVADMETVDDGNNVLDGFVITIDDLDEAETISFNWNLLDENGNPIGMPGTGNAYGFGTVNLARIPINTDPDSEFRIFPENTGVGNATQLFAEDSYKVTEYASEDYDETKTIAPKSLALSPQSAAENGESDDSEQVIALFAAEFGAGITAPFLNPTDNIFNSGTNTNPIDYSSSPPTDTENVPEPSMMGASLLAGVGFWRRRRRQKKQCGEKK